MSRSRPLSGDFLLTSENNPYSSLLKYCVELNKLNVENPSFLSEATRIIRLYILTANQMEGDEQDLLTAQNDDLHNILVNLGLLEEEVLDSLPNTPEKKLILDVMEAAWKGDNLTLEMLQILELTTPEKAAPMGSAVAEPSSSELVPS